MEHEFGEGDDFFLCRVDLRLCLLEVSRPKISLIKGMRDLFGCKADISALETRKCDRKQQTK